MIEKYTSKLSDASNEYDHLDDSIGKFLNTGYINYFLRSFFEAHELHNLYKNYKKIIPYDDGSKIVATLEQDEDDGLPLITVYIISYDCTGEEEDTIVLDWQDFEDILLELE